jgi:hypothetical protein
MQNPHFPDASAQPPATPKTSFAWCVWDVVAKCHPDRRCDTCPLWNECRGRAKAASGFLSVDDLLAMKSRVSSATWNHEMLCHPPTLENAVFPAFSRDAHVRACPLAGIQPRPGDDHTLDGRPLGVEYLDAGVDFGFRVVVCLWILILRDPQGRRVVWVADEFVGRGWVVERNIAALRQRTVPSLPGTPPSSPAPWLPSIIYCDVAGNHTNSQTGQRDQALLRAAGFRVLSAPMEIEAGIARINDLLDPALGPRPRFCIDPRCLDLLRAMESYRRAPAGKIIKDGTHDHPVDALRYALVNHDRPRSRTSARTY